MEVWPSEFKMELANCSEPDPDLDTDATGTRDVHTTKDNWMNTELYNELYWVPGTENEYNFKNIITNPSALKPIFGAFGFINDDHKVSPW